MNRNILFGIIIGILLLVSIVQGVQINSIKDKLGDAGLKEPSVKAPTQKTSQVVSQPSSGGMVGGC